MPLCNLYEIHYTIIKTTIKETLSLEKECLILANSIREAEDKFNKEFTAKRGTSYEVTMIQKYYNMVIK